LVFVDADADRAVHACQRLREAIRALRITAEDGRDLGTITASFGVATTRGPGLDRPALIAAADEALYAAKRAGRDRVMHIDDVDERLATSSTDGA
ncbi:MAG TPA: diguanylate cyclase, partial [Egicoccus sp.]